MFGYTLRVAIERTNGTLGICEFVFSNVRISCKKKKQKTQMVTQLLMSLLL